MRRLLLALGVCATLAACSGASPPDDAGVDGGVDAGSDAGQPVCFGVPANVTSFTCVAAETPYTDWCLATVEQTLAAQTTDCDAGAGIVGYVSELSCADLRAAAWTYGFPGDTFECFYPRDGGALSGFINYSDHGTLVGGTVGGDGCTPLAAPSCRDGG
jgi:hypothetical protein